MIPSETPLLLRRSIEQIRSPLDFWGACEYLAFIYSWPTKEKNHG